MGEHSIEVLRKAYDAFRQAISVDTDRWDWSLNEQTEEQNDAFGKLLSAVEEVLK